LKKGNKAIGKRVRSTKLGVYWWWKERNSWC